MNKKNLAAKTATGPDRKSEHWGTLLHPSIAQEWDQSILRETQVGRHERRSQTRAPLITEVKVSNSKHLRSLEISTGGIFLETITFYPFGTILDLQFKVRKTDEHSINVQGKVLYNHKQIGVGLIFLNLRPEDFLRIEKFVSETVIDNNKDM